MYIKTQLGKPKKNKNLCDGCHDNFYNNDNTCNVKECWHFKSSKVVKRFCIGWWTPMTKPENFTEVYVLSCYHDEQPDKHVYLEDLPRHIKEQIAERKKQERLLGRTK